MQIKKQIKKYIPEWCLSAYHHAIAVIAALKYGFPSRDMIVIGITGTKGKTSTANFIWSVLNTSGAKTGLIGTANIRVGNIELMNDRHMTMPGPFILQKILREMKDAGCTHVEMEVTSEGMTLHREVGIYFDIAVFTNLTPEHLPSHGGSFERYKEAKTKLFASLMSHAKTIGGIEIQKVIIANADSEHAMYYLEYPAHKKLQYGITYGDLRAHDIVTKTDSISFSVGEEKYLLRIPGIFNIYNALPAIAIGRHFGISEKSISAGLTNLDRIPGRMERIEEGQPFIVFIDYAHEKVSMNLLLDTALAMRENGKKIIVLLGAEGGGRDKAKREHMGNAAGEKADYVIVSNVDPYEDDPQEIADGIAKFARLRGKRDGDDLFVILDREAGIRKALSLAAPGDIVLITGKGSEQSMCVYGKTIPWDDRPIVRNLIKELMHA